MGSKRSQKPCWSCVCGISLGHEVEFDMWDRCSEAGGVGGGRWDEGAWSQGWVPVGFY